MTVSKKIGTFVAAGIIALCGLELGESLSIPGVHSFVSTAEARVGRPLTPVSVAGVGRRTARRCAAGVRHC
jgi:hypothetical protein